MHFFVFLNYRGVVSRCSWFCLNSLQGRLFGLENHRQPSEMRQGVGEDSVALLRAVTRAVKSTRG